VTLCGKDKTVALTSDDKMNAMACRAETVLSVTLVVTSIKRRHLLYHQSCSVMWSVVSTGRQGATHTWPRYCRHRAETQYMTSREVLQEVLNPFTNTFFWLWQKWVYQSVQDHTGLTHHF